MAYAGEITMKPAATICEKSLSSVQQALEMVVEDLFIGKPIVLHAGSFHDLKPAALDSGMNRATVVQAIAIVERMLKRNRDQDSVLGTTYKYLQKYDRDSDSLMVCVTGESCQMIVGTIFVPDESKLALSNVNRLKVRPPLDGRIPHLLMFNGGPIPFFQQGVVASSSIEALGWAADILASASSFAAFRLISDWIEVNTRLRQVDEQSDELFDRYVHIGPKLRIDTGFFRVFEASRAAVVTSALAPNHAAALRKHAMAELEVASSDTQDVVAHFNLRPDNIIEFANRITGEMARTIRRSTRH